MKYFQLSEKDFAVISECLDKIRELAMKARMDSDYSRTGYLQEINNQCRRASTLMHNADMIDEEEIEAAR